MTRYWCARAFIQWRNALQLAMKRFLQLSTTLSRHLITGIVIVIFMVIK